MNCFSYANEEQNCFVTEKYLVRSANICPAFMTFWFDATVLLTKLGKKSERLVGNTINECEKKK